MHSFVKLGQHGSRLRLVSSIPVSPAMSSPAAALFDPLVEAVRDGLVGEPGPVLWQGRYWSFERFTCRAASVAFVFSDVDVVSARPAAT